MFIIGCGGHARSVANIVLENYPDTEITFIDDNAREEETIMGFAVVKTMQPKHNIFVAIGDNYKRSQVARGKQLCSIISRTATVSPDAIIENGCFIGAGAHVGPFAHIGRGSIINTNAVVEHDVKIGNFCHLAPNVTVCGKSRLGNFVFLGAGSSVKDNIDICRDVTVGAGGVVVKSITRSGTYIGIPADIKKDTNPT